MLSPEEMNKGVSEVEFTTLKEQCLSICGELIDDIVKDFLNFATEEIASNDEFACKTTVNFMIE